MVLAANYSRKVLNALTIRQGTNEEQIIALGVNLGIKVINTVLRLSRALKSTVF